MTDRSDRAGGLNAVDAFDLGFSWAWGLRGQSLEDSRAIGRTLCSDLFAGLDINLDGFNSFQTSDEGIVDAKRRIKAAIASPPSGKAGERLEPEPSRAMLEDALGHIGKVCEECGKQSLETVVEFIRRLAAPPQAGA